MRVRHTDGRERWIQITSAPRRLANGNTCWDGVQTDITARRVAEMRERQNEALLAAVVDSASDAIVSGDLQGRITLFNPAAERIFRRSAAEVLGSGFSALVSLRSDTPGERQAEAPGEMRTEGEVLQRMLGSSRVLGIRADGVRLELEASVTLVTVNNRRVFNAILRDVTERVRTERALVQYQSELTELTQALMAQEKATTSRLAQVLHDQLGQTLAAIRIEFVADAPSFDAAETARHARVDKLIDQAVREVRQVLVELRPTVLDERGLCEALDNEMNGPRMSSGEVAMDLIASDELRAQRWSADVEYAAFMVAREAIANALRHAKATSVFVVVDGGPSTLRLEISDNGSGFEPREMSAKPGHLGMVGMRERSIAIGARFEVNSSPGRGTSVCLTWQGSEQ
jgi:PAS domain S-box-containing protein